MMIYKVLSNNAIFAKMNYLYNRHNRPRYPTRPHSWSEISIQTQKPSQYEKHVHFVTKNSDTLYFL